MKSLLEKMCDITKANFWKKVLKTDKCWFWIGAKDRAGYGKMRIGIKNAFAHRFAYEITVGEIGAGLYICHRCNNPACVNPTHLYAGTQLENMADARKTGLYKKISRINKKRTGSKNNAARLTEAKVLEIRKKYDCGESTQEELAKEYGVGQSTIGRVVHRTYWTHI